MSSIRIVLTGSNDPYLEGLRTFLQPAKDIEVAGAAHGEAALFDAIQEQKPHLVLVNIQAVRQNGLHLLKLLQQKTPWLPSIAFAYFQSPEELSGVLQAGAKGCLDKDCTADELSEALQTVTKGQYFYSPTCRSLLAGLVMANPVYKPAPTFSTQELAIIQLVCKEYSNKEIAHALQLSVNSIERALMKIRGKMSVKSPGGMVLYSMRHQLVGEP